jgi:heme-degrading monooxygenase HmoA/ketosteroid isomerase-like protein
MRKSLRILLPVVLAASALAAQPAGPRIARVWRGWVKTADADAYQKYLSAEGTTRIRRLPGNLGAEMWRRTEGEKTEFVVVTKWESKAAIRNFTGPDWEKVRPLPDDAKWLVPPPATVAHYEIVEPVGGGGSAEKELLDVERRWADALTAADAGAVAGILAPQFRDTAWDGRVRGRDEAIAAAGSRKAGAVEQNLEDLRARVFGDTGIVTGINVVTAPSRSARVRFTDVFVRRGGRWMAVSAQETVEAAPEAR